MLPRRPMRCGPSALATALLLGVALSAVGPVAAVSLEAPGLSLDLDAATGAVTAVRAGEVTAGSAPASAGSGFLVDDAAAGTTPEPVRGALRSTAEGAELAGLAAQARVRVAASFRVRGEAIHVAGTVTDMTGTDRAIVLRFRLPIDAAPRRWVWDDDIVSARPTDQDGVYENTQKLNYDHVEVSRWASRYPLCALRTETVGVSLAVPLDPPRVSILRHVRQAEAGYLEVSFEFGLARETAKFPSQASFAFVLYPHDPAWGFRSALERYYQLHPDSFRTGASQAGLWYINTDPETLDRPWDFHFRFDEVATLRPAKVLFNNLFGYYAFHYAEPWGRWHFFGDHPVKKQAHRPEDVGVDPDELTRRFLASDLARERPDISEWVRRSAAYGPDGKWLWLRWFDVYRPGDWTSFIITVIDPDIPGGYGEANLQGVRDAFALKCFPGGYADWAREQGLHVDGIYLDSIGGWTGFLPDSFRRELWAYADVPLLFDHASKRPVQNHALANWEFVKALSAQLRRDGRLLMANTHPPVDTLFFPLLDMIGSEAGGESFSSPRSRRAYMRSYAYRKPVSWLDYNDGGYTDPKVPLERKEWAMHRCLPYALFPGTGNFWDGNREGYEAVRPLYRKYLPLFEELAAAGWEPIPYATCLPEAPAWVVERFGHLDRTGAVYLAVECDRESPGGEAVVTLDAGPLGVPDQAPGTGLLIHELVSGTELAPTGWAAGRVSFRLVFAKPWETQLIRLATPARLAALCAERALRAAQDAQAYLLWRSRPHANEGRTAQVTGRPLDPDDTEANRRQVQEAMVQADTLRWLAAMEAVTKAQADDVGDASLRSALGECARMEAVAATAQPAALWQDIVERAQAAAELLRQAVTYRRQVRR